jgi:glycosyltransferase involved in cell wall biosynthesis
MLNNAISLPMVSINMIAYNVEKYIQRAIDSILTQTYTDWELIVVDDGSTDRTLEIAKSYTDARIKIVPCLHIGKVSNLRNIGLEHSTGRYLISIDADDIHEPDAIESLYNYLADNPQCSAVYGFKTFIDSQDNPLEVPGYDISFVDKQGQFHLNPQFYHTWRNILDEFYYSQVASLMIPRATLDRVGYYNEKALSEDTEYYLRLFADRFEGVHFIPKALYRHRIHTTSISNDINRLGEALDRIPSNVNEIYYVVHYLAGLNYPKQALIAKQYKRHLSIQLNFKHYDALPRIYAHALRNPEMPLLSIINITVLEGIRFFSPGFFYNILRPFGKKLKVTLSGTQTLQQKALAQ